MKKFISIFIILIVLSLVLCASASAATERIVTISEDYNELYFNGSTYIRRDTSMLSYDNSFKYNSDEYGSYYTDCPMPVNYNGQYTIKLTDKQHKEIDMVEIFDVNTKETIFTVIIYFKDGSELHIDFLREDLVEEYDKITNGNVDKFTIDFMWPDGNAILLDKEDFYIGNKTTIDQYECEEEFPVSADSVKGGFDAEIGSIYVKNDNYFFYSYIDAGFKSLDDFIENSDSKIKVIKLTDEDIINEIEIGIEKYYEDDYGYLYNDELTEFVSKIFFIIVFAIVPAVVFVASLILAVKSKKSLYKRLLFATGGISLAVIVTFVYIAFTLFNT